MRTYKSYHLLLLTMVSCLVPFGYAGAWTEIPVETDNSVASNETYGEVTLTIGSTAHADSFHVTCTGNATLRYDTPSRTLSLQDVQLSLSPFEVSFPFLLWTIQAQLSDIVAVPASYAEATVDPATSGFTADVQLDMNAVATISINGRIVFENEPLYLTTVVPVSGSFVSTGDSDGDGLEEFQLRISGPVTFEFLRMEVPLIGEVSVRMEGDLDLGFSGEQQGCECIDLDRDGYGNPACELCPHPDQDCDDSNPQVFPGAPEICDGADNQCPGDSGYGQTDEFVLVSPQDGSSQSTAPTFSWTHGCFDAYQFFSVFYYDLGDWAGYYPVQFWTLATGFPLPSSWWDKLGNTETCYWAVLGYNLTTGEWAVAGPSSFDKKP